MRFLHMGYFCNLSMTCYQLDTIEKEIDILKSSLERSNVELRVFVVVLTT